MRGLIAYEKAIPAMPRAFFRDSDGKAIVFESVEEAEWAIRESGQIPCLFEFIEIVPMYSGDRRRFRKARARAANASD